MVSKICYYKGSLAGFAGELGSGKRIDWASPGLGLALGSLVLRLLLERGSNPTIDIEYIDHAPLPE